MKRARQNLVIRACARARRRLYTFAATARAAAVDSLWPLKRTIRSYVCLRATDIAPPFTDFVVMSRRPRAGPTSSSAAAAPTVLPPRFSPDAAERELAELKAEAKQLQRDKAHKRDTVSSRMRANEVDEAIAVIGQRGTASSATAPVQRVSAAHCACACM